MINIFGDARAAATAFAYTFIFAYRHSLFIYHDFTIYTYRALYTSFRSRPFSLKLAILRCDFSPLAKVSARE